MPRRRHVGSQRATRRRPVAPTRSHPRLAPDAGAAALAAHDRLTAPAVERGTAAGADASGWPTTDGGAVGLTPDEGAARPGPGLKLDAAVAAMAGRGNERPKLRRGHSGHGLEVIHHDHHPIGRPGYRINTAQEGETRPRAQRAAWSPGRPCRTHVGTPATRSAQARHGLETGSWRRPPRVLRSSTRHGSPAAGA
jgi:hypothetical protein